MVPKQMQERRQAAKPRRESPVVVDGAVVVESVSFSMIEAYTGRTSGSGYQ